MERKWWFKYIVWPCVFVLIVWLCLIVNKDFLEAFFNYAELD